MSAASGPSVPMSTTPGTRRCTTPRSGPAGFWAGARQARRLDQAVQPRRGARRRLHRRCPYPLVPRRRAERLRPIASTAISPSARTRRRSSGKATIPAKSNITYRELHAEVCRMVTRSARRQERRSRHHLPADDPRGGYAMLACTRIGAIHSVVFGGFSPTAWPTALSTATVHRHHRRRGPARRQAGAAQGQRRRGADRKVPRRQHVLVVRHTGGGSAGTRARDVWWHEIAAEVPAECAPEPMGDRGPAVHPYTSGSTGKPKGVLCTTGGYLVRLDDAPVRVRLPRRRRLLVHRRRRLGDRPQLHRLRPLANGATTLMFEGVPNYPDARTRFWQVIDKHRSTSSTPRRPRSAP